MSQICLRDVTLSHTSSPLISGANVVIEEGERVCLIGRNGVGKSTLLRVLNGELMPDQGVIEKTQSLKVALLSQNIPEAIEGSVQAIVEQHLPKNDHEYWQETSNAAKILSKLKLNPQLSYSELSGGMKRLVLLACIMVQDPDVLILDEPTNHLDIANIELLENMLLSFRKTIIFVTHDRELLQKLATKIIEIDNGKLISWQGSYVKYLEHKENLLAAEEKANALFDKRLAQEEQWIRQGIKARRTRNEGRVRALKKMRVERQQRRTRPGQVNFGNQATSLSGKIVFEATDVSFSFNNRVIVKDFSTTILRGEKIGIIGPNGIGKSTLINLLLGKIPPQKGQITQGTNLTIGYFDQHRMQLDENKSIIDSVAELGQTITINNHEKHIISYLQDFLFSPQQARGLVKNLSGGEKNRVMLAKMFSKPCNLLIMDEPTNDLDIETLELLEELLLNFSGTLLLISHDRAFLNNVVTSVLVFNEGGHIEEFIGGYEDYRLSTPTPEPKDKKTAVRSKTATPKLTFKEQHELNRLPNTIERLELRQAEINLALTDPNLYKNQPDLVKGLTEELKQVEGEIAESYSLWEELEARSK